NFVPCGSMSYATYDPLRAVIAKLVDRETASGGTTSVRPAAGMEIVPPSGPIVCDTVMSDGSGVVRSTGMIVFVDVVPRRPPRRLCEAPSDGAAAAGPDGGSFEHAEAASVAMTATTNTAGRRRRIVAILIGCGRQVPSVPLASPTESIACAK